MISIVNYGLGNLGSIKNMLRRIGVPALVVDNPEELNSATKIILPGVGAFDTGMQHLVKNGWLEMLNQKVLSDKIPVLGICLGMQLMTRSSEEGTLAGLGWIDAEVKKFSFATDVNLKVPHMGWNRTAILKPSKLTEDLPLESRFYFVHSYFVDSNSRDQDLMVTNYGRDFVSAFERENIVGVQFHPEKSHKFGLQLLKNFVEKY